jgi:(p)ppGpp synthase/HD superfamily hydrolase
MECEMSELVRKARAFAMKAHEGHVRKYTGAPYFVHLAEVAAIVASVGGSREMVAAAYLHDTVEDVGVKFPEIGAEFGVTVERMVYGLTNLFTKEAYPMFNRAWRKKAEATRLRGETASVHTIKLADLISNAGSIIWHDPKFAKVFVPEVLWLAENLYKGDGRLHAKLAEVLAAYPDRGRHALPV